MSYGRLQRADGELDRFKLAAEAEKPGPCVAMFENLLAKRDGPSLARALKELLKLPAFNKDKLVPVRGFGPQISQTLLHVLQTDPTASMDLALVPPETLSKVVGWVEVIEDDLSCVPPGERHGLFVPLTRWHARTVVLRRPNGTDGPFSKLIYELPADKLQALKAVRINIARALLSTAKNQLDPLAVQLLDISQRPAVVLQTKQVTAHRLHLSGSNAGNWLSLEIPGIEKNPCLYPLWMIPYQLR